MTSLTELAAAALADAERGTPGPWEIIVDDNAQQNIYADHGFDWIAMLPHQCVSSIEDMRKVDAEFIAAARTREPLLAAGVINLTRQLAEARAALKDACAIIEGLVPRPRHSGESVATANSLRKRGGL